MTEPILFVAGFGRCGTTMMMTDVTTRRIISVQKTI